MGIAAALFFGIFLGVFLVGLILIPITMLLLSCCVKPERVCKFYSDLLEKFMRYYFLDSYIVGIIVMNIVFYIVKPNAFKSTNPSGISISIWVLFSINELLLIIILVVGSRAARILESRGFFDKQTSTSTPFIE